MDAPSALTPEKEPRLVEPRSPSEGLGEEKNLLPLRGFKENLSVILMFSNLLLNSNYFILSEVDIRRFLGIPFLRIVTTS